MKVISGRDFARIVERRGWRLLRVAGSHPIHGNRPLKTGLLRHLAKLAEVEDELQWRVQSAASPVRWRFARSARRGPILYIQPRHPGEFTLVRRHKHRAGRRRPDHSTLLHRSAPPRPRRLAPPLTRPVAGLPAALSRKAGERIRVRPAR